MMRKIFVASAMVVAAPALAQRPETAASTSPTVGMGAANAPGTQVSAREGTPSAATDQVSAIVNAEFASYDKDGNGLLEKAEFAAWMDALKAKAPSGGDKPGDAEWNAAAFAKADKDKSQSLTRRELTDFLGTPVKSDAG